MKEKYWDPINKAAALVTIFTGVPAFLSFIGFTYLSAISLGILSITSLVFVLVRGRMLEARGNRLVELNKNDETIIKRFNEIIIGNTQPAQLYNFQSLLDEALENIRRYVESDTSCKVVVSIREITPNMDVASVASSSSYPTELQVLNIRENTDLSNVWDELSHVIYYPQEVLIKII